MLSSRDWKKRRTHGAGRMGIGGVMAPLIISALPRPMAL
jgi:hypothetical protein